MALAHTVDTLLLSNQVELTQSPLARVRWQIETLCCYCAKTLNCYKIHHDMGMELAQCTILLSTVLSLMVVLTISTRSTIGSLTTTASATWLCLSRAV